MRIIKLYDIDSDQSYHEVVDWAQKEWPLNTLIEQNKTCVVRSMSFDDAKAEFARTMREVGRADAVKRETREFFGL